MSIQFQEFLTGPSPAKEGVKCLLFAEIVARCGKAKFKAQGTSMLPSIWPGDTLLVEREGVSGLTAGDIAVYLRCGRLFAHRVLRVAPDRPARIVTRGDALEEDDPPVLAREIVGRVAAVVPGPRLAYRFRRLRAALKSAAAFLFLLQR
jgi:hypothetical protein